MSTRAGGNFKIPLAELSPGSLVVAEQPLLVLDPPTDRKTLLKTLGCDWCKVGVEEKRLVQPFS